MCVSGIVTPYVFQLLSWCHYHCQLCECVPVTCVVRGVTTVLSYVPVHGRLHKISNSEY
jgi:hypothetical protein